MIRIIEVLIIAYLLNNITISIYCKIKFNRAKAKKINMTYGNNDASQNSRQNNRLSLLIQNYIDGWIRYNIILLGRFPCHWYRNLLLKRVFRMNLGKDIVIYGGFEIRSPWNIYIGDGTIIGDNSILDGRNEIMIGKNVNFSTGVWIWTEQHDYNHPLFAPNNKGGKVVIGERTWISSRVSVLPNIEIAEGCVVGTGAVVTHNCEAFGLYVGIPAKKIGERNKNLTYSFNGDHMPFY